MTHITDIKEIYKISKEIFGENFLQINDPINKISHAWKYINYAYDQSWRLGQNIIVPEAKDLISTLNFYVIFKKLDLMDSKLKIETDQKSIQNFHENLITNLKSTETYEANWNMISLPAFLEGSPVVFHPIIESDQERVKTPDLLAVYKGNRVLFECKTTNFNIEKENALKNNIEKRLKKARIQLESYPDIPGICLIKTNNEKLFRSITTMMEMIEKKIDRNLPNLSCILFTLYNDENFPSSVKLDYLPFINFRSKVLLPKHFLKDVFGNVGTLLISTRKGERIYFDQIKEICNHYEIDPQLEELEKRFSK